MARRKSPYGRLKKIYLQYRENDPRYAGIEELIRKIPDGNKNTRMLDALYAGISAGPDVGSSISTPAQLPSLVVPPPGDPPLKSINSDFSAAAVSAFTHDWGTHAGTNK